MRDLVKGKKRSKIYFRPIVVTTNLNEFKSMTEKYRKYRRVFLISEHRYNTFTGEQIRYSYLELRTVKKVFRYMSFTLPHFEEFN